MELEASETIAKIRTAIDDIAPEVDDSFSEDTDAELTQALLHAIDSLLMSVPLALLDPSVDDGTSGAAGGTSGATGGEGSGSAAASPDVSGTIGVPDDFLRFVKLDVGGWTSSLFELMDAGSEEAKRQRTRWGRGTASKPRGMIDFGSDGGRIVRYWPSGESPRLTYVPRATEEEGTITCALHEECEKNIIYLAASIFLEGKKEGDVAARFRQLAEL